MKKTALFTLATLISCLILFTASNVRAQAYCDGNFDYDQDVDGTDAATFKTNFGRSLFKNPCPSDGPAPVPITGQTLSFQSQDDGDLQMGVAPENQRFTDNGDNTITDNLTGLMWTKSAALFGQKYNWHEAFDQVSVLNGVSIYDDWRIPNIRELMSLIDFGKGVTRINCEEFIPALPEGHPFVNVKFGDGFACPDDWYWASTGLQGIIGAYIVSFYYGQIKTQSTNVDVTSYVWPVRGGRSPLSQ